MAKVSAGTVRSAISVFRNDRQRDRKKLIGDLVSRRYRSSSNVSTWLLDCSKTFAEFLDGWSSTAERISATSPTMLPVISPPGLFSRVNRTDLRDPAAPSALLRRQAVF